MNLNLKGKSAYVTGGAQGIGAAIAIGLAGEGVRVVLSDISEAELEKTTSSLPNPQLRHVSCHVDLSTAAGVSQSLETVLEVLSGPPDLLVNNVGVATSRNFVQISDDEWNDSFQLNFMPHVRTCRGLLPLMLERGGSNIIVSSDLAKQPEIVPVDYGSFKAALLYFSKALAREFAPAVRTNAVLPGPTWTGLWSRPGGVVDGLKEVYGIDDPEQALRAYLDDRQLTMGLAQPEDVASMVLYLLSPLSSQINGAAIDIGGTIRGLV